MSKTNETDQQEATSAEGGRVDTLVMRIQEIVCEWERKATQLEESGDFRPHSADEFSYDAGMASTLSNCASDLVELVEETLQDA